MDFPYLKKKKKEYFIVVHAFMQAGNLTQKKPVSKSGNPYMKAKLLPLEY